jgi:predicted RNA-binding protein associated with RNAse of E/G family
MRSQSTLVRRYFRGPHLTWAQATRVVADDERGLLLWLPVGAGFACRVNDEGGFLRAAKTIDAYGAAPLSVRTWRGADVLLLHPPGAAHSVWWFFSGGTFTGWYVNLESPAHRRDGGIDVVDHHLDVVLSPDRSWRWKDEDEFTAGIGLPGFWDAEEAAAIRAEGERVIAAAEAGDFPFDGTWRDFVPDADWPVPALPAEYRGDPESLQRG